MEGVVWYGSDDGGTWTAFGPNGGDGGSWRWGSAHRYRRSFSDEPPYWRAYFLLNPIGGDYTTADEAKAAVEAAVEVAERE